MSSSHPPSSPGGSAGQGLGNAINGIISAVHGAGEVIRGNINSFFDRTGEALLTEAEKAARNHQNGHGHHDDNTKCGGKGPEENDRIAREGVEEVKRGIDNITGGGPAVGRKVEEEGGKTTVQQTPPPTNKETKRDGVQTTALGTCSPATASDKESDTGKALTNDGRSNLGGKGQTADKPATKTSPVTSMGMEKSMPKKTPH